MNSQQEHTLLHSAGLSFDPATGQVQAGAESLRLGPVNMKVLMLLLESGNRVVSRTEFFDKVWARQLVSDDVLTRAISDLRTQLGAHTEAPVLIETIPKRGYRWLPPVASAPGMPLAAVAPATVPLAVPAVPLRTGTRVLVWAAAVLAGLLLLSSSVLWVLGSHSASGRIKVAALPVQAAAAEQQIATEIDRLLQEQLLVSEQFELLAFSATSLHLQNPFPVLAREYGVQYVLEGRIQTWQSHSTLTLNLVDARSATVIDSVSADVGATSDLQALSQGFIARFSERVPAL
jgi:DNA-binding winged helix-turn-helix (wHTH) protein/TolB-like protein